MMKKHRRVIVYGLMIGVLLTSCGSPTPPEDLSLRGKLSGQLYGLCEGIYIFCSLDVKSEAVVQHAEIPMAVESFPAPQDKDLSPDKSKFITSGWKISNLQMSTEITLGVSVVFLHVWTSDSRYLAALSPDITADRKSFINVFVIDTDTGESWSAFHLENLIDYEDLNAKTLGNLVWSPDNQYLAMIWNPPDKREYLLIATRDGKQVTRYGDKTPLQSLRYWAP